MKIKKYPKWFVDELKYVVDKEKATNGNLSLREKVLFICPIHGEYFQRVTEHINSTTLLPKQGCPICGRIKRVKSRLKNEQNKRPDYPQWFIDELANEEVKQKAKERSISWSEKVVFKCPIHGEYSQRIDAHMNTATFQPKQGCPICGRVKQQEEKKKTESKSRKYPQWFIDELSLEEDKQRARDGLITTHEKLLFTCSKHGYYSQIVSNHITLSTGEPACKCPICTHQVSQYEQELFDYLKSIDPILEQRNRSMIRSLESDRPMELDIYFPNRRLAVEFNGSLWHGEKFKEDKLYHQKKFLLCEQENIRLISVFDKDWFTNKERLKFFFQNLLSPHKKVYGRETIVRKINSSMSKVFYETYHLKGGGYYSVSYGLFYKDSLVSVMSFSKPKFGKQKSVEWDLTRYCVKPNITVIGGAHKLLFAFQKEYSPKSIITYSDNDYFTGFIYSQLGFNLVGQTKVPYYWAKDNQFLEREQCQPKQLLKLYPDLYADAEHENARNKEEYIMHRLGYYKVYRCGNKKWLKVFQE
jgi:hypothetical protein